MSSSHRPVLTNEEITEKLKNISKEILGDILWYDENADPEKMSDFHRSIYQYHKNRVQEEGGKAVEELEGL